MPPRYGSPPIGNTLEILSEDAERVFCRAWRSDAERSRKTVLAILPTAEDPLPAILDRLIHEHRLKDQLDEAWAVRPLELERGRGRTMLVLEDPGGEPLDRLLGTPMEIGRFLELAIGIATALSQLHQHGLVHKDIKPGNLIVNCADTQVRLTGFGIASRLPRERQSPDPPQIIAGTLAYMAPEQTGRMNRCIDSRSDLYALGVTFYEMLTGRLPFAAADAAEWVHCHIARHPVAPARRLDSIPGPISELVMKLLAKAAEDRYQSAAGLERDLRRCLAAWQAYSRIDEFALGESDTPDRLFIPEKLYGRKREIEALLAAFDRVVTGAAPELVLVSGYSGVGKSAIANEMHRLLVPARGLFAAGKFDQYKRDIPYATLVQAFQSLVRPLLSKSDAELGLWREALHAALGANGQLIVDLVPELKLIIGDQPPVAELPPQQAQSRFQLVFRGFISVFAQADHPLALFLDDLQWIDAATLDLLEDLLTRADLSHLLLIGAYRDNEVDAAHPLMRKLEAVKRSGARLDEITLAPLGLDDVEAFIADTLRASPAQCTPLSRLVQEKTAGNPFFMIQFLSALAEEGLVTFDYGAARWCWDIDRIRAKGYTDNVVDLMVGKLGRLSAETRAALQRLACLGNSAETSMLAMILGTTEEDVHAALWDGVRQELIERLETSYRFTHDRVQEAAYAQIPEQQRAEAHLLIGRLLVAQTPPETREEAIFEIVNQLNRGRSLIRGREESEELAALNLVAGMRAKASTAYASALTYFAAGSALLAEGGWERQHDLAFALALHQAECELLTGALTAVEQRLPLLSTGADRTVERAKVACLGIDLYLTLDQTSRAIAVGLDYLRHLGIAWSPHPTEEEARRDFERVWARLERHATEELVDWPLMSDPASLATLDVLTKFVPPAFYTDVNLVSLAICQAITLSLEHGNSDASAAAYVRLGMVAALRFGRYQAAYRFGWLGYELVERRGLARFRAEVYMNFGNMVMPWTRHVKTGRDLIRRAFEAARNAGDLIYAALCNLQLNTNLLAAGDALQDVQHEVENGVAFARRVRFGSSMDFLGVQLALVRTLRGLTFRFGSFDDEQFNEAQIERRFARNPDVAPAECWYQIRKLQARFFAGDLTAALDAAAHAQVLLQRSLTTLETTEYHFYSALARAASCEAATPEERAQHLAAVVAHQRELAVWAENCPENFESRAALVGAEVASLEGRALEAMRLYEQAIRSARANGFLPGEALANELAARFYAARGFDTLSHASLRNARACYLRWGASGKVRQLDQIYPHLGEEGTAAGPTRTFGAPVEHLDLAMVIKVSQAVAGEMVEQKLLDTLMRVAIEQAGAERGLLILTREGEPRIEAEVTTRGESVFVQLCDEAVRSDLLPESILLYVLHSRESVVLDDAAIETAFSMDPYIRRHTARSVLCLPLINQAKLIGALYLENNLASRVFAPSRIAVLKLIASQAAISLENTRLYRDLAEREARIRRLVEANIIGIFLWSIEDGDVVVVDANDAFLQMIGYERSDIVLRRLRWTELIPLEWRARALEARAELARAGTLQAYEHEYAHRDGSRVPVLVGAATFDQARDHGVAFVLDLTDRKRVEAEARESERSYREVQAQLAHANRVATIGQLTASIAHEVNQPIAATVTNASAALRWLNGRTPNVEEVRLALGRILKDGNRAGEVIRRIRSLIKGAPAKKDSVAINDAILEVIALTRGEAMKNRVLVETHLDETLPLIEGDRVELQQVMLNLMINAIEAMSTVRDGTRELRISTARAEDDGIIVTVRDSGPGLAPEQIERFFEPFHTTKPNGLGLGLSICRSIIESNGGRLWAGANEPRGAFFQFILPIGTAEILNQSGGASS